MAGIGEDSGYFPAEHEEQEREEPQQPSAPFLNVKKKHSKGECSPRSAPNAPLMYRSKLAPQCRKSSFLPPLLSLGLLSNTNHVFRLALLSTSRLALSCRNLQHLSNRDSQPPFDRSRLPLASPSSPSSPCLHKSSLLHMVSPRNASKRHLVAELRVSPLRSVERTFLLLPAAKPATRNPMSRGEKSSTIERGESSQSTKRSTSSRRTKDCDSNSARWLT